MSRRSSRCLAVTLTRSAGAIGPACSTAIKCRGCLGPTMSSKVTSAIRGAACCGPRGRRAKRSGRCNARAPGSSYPGHRQRPRSWAPYVKSHPRTWHRKGNALLRIANVSACRAGPCDRPKRNLINCVRDGRRYRLQAQGDFCGIAPQPCKLSVMYVHCVSITSTAPCGSA